MVCMKSQFTKHLARLNRLEPGLWLLGPGMAFGDTHHWWGEKKKRPVPHNGVDLAFLKTPDGVQHDLGAGTVVPTPFDGRIARVISDFLGMSVFLLHDIEVDGGMLVSALGHLAPNMLLKVGAGIKSGATVGSIAKPKDKSVPPHLHLTIARVPKDIKTSTLSWELMDSADSSSNGVSLIDPRKFF